MTPCFLPSNVTKKFLTMEVYAESNYIKKKKILKNQQQTNQPQTC